MEDSENPNKNSNEQSSYLNIKTGWNRNRPDRALEEKIIERFLSGRAKEAEKLIADNGLDSEQFSAYRNPSEDQNEIYLPPRVRKIIYDNDNRLKSKKNTEHNENHYENSNAQEKPRPANPMVAPGLLVNGPYGNPVPFYSACPYTYDELIKITRLKDQQLEPLCKIVGGIINSYVSVDMMRVLNMREFLGKMSEVPALKNEAKQMQKFRHSLEDDISADFIFEEMMESLDNRAYKINLWQQSSSRLKDVYSTARNQQKERMRHIPYDEKKKFVESIVNSPSVPIESYGYHHHIKDIESRTKAGYARYIEFRLNGAWNNSAQNIPSQP